MLFHHLHVVAIVSAICFSTAMTRAMDGESTPSDNASTKNENSAPQAVAATEAKHVGHRAQSGASTATSAASTSTGATDSSTEGATAKRTMFKKKIEDLKKRLSARRKGGGTAPENLPSNDPPNP